MTLGVYILFNDNIVLGDDNSFIVPSGTGTVHVELRRNFGDELIGSTASFTYIPVSNICFLGNTPITTDQGNIAIEDIDPELYTITKTKTKVCFEKDALYRNVPSQKTIMSKTHKVCHLGKMKEAHRFCNKSDKVYKVPYQGQTLYNVLMEKHRTMKVNNLICETLHPKHEMAKINLNK